MRTKLFPVLVVLVCANAGSAQNKNLAVEYNFYPAGHIPGLQLEWAPSTNHHTFNVRMAANITRRKNFSGLNDNEEGWGPGAGLGYRYYFDPECKGLYLGTRIDFWSLKVDWRDSSDVKKAGTTNILVLQPTFELGYFFRLSRNWSLGAAFTNGVEINVRTKGDEVGQGWITLWQVRLARYI